MSMRTLTGFGLLLALTITLAAPRTADAQLIVTKKEIERQMRLRWLEMKRGLPILPNKRVQAYAQCVAHQIIDVLDDEYKDLNWEVIVFDDPATNAEVMPGGKIAIYSGILDVADTPAALAAVIGHETAHLTQNHVMERARAASKTNALVILGNAATGLGGMIGAGAQLGLMLPYQRGQESEADLVGMGYMAKAGYDPRATLYLWKNMIAHDDRRASEFLSTHPAPDTRMEDLARNLAPALIEYNDAVAAGKNPDCQL